MTEGSGDGVAPGRGGVGEGNGEGAVGDEAVAARGAEALGGHVGGAGPLDEIVGAGGVGVDDRVYGRMTW